MIAFRKTKTERTVIAGIASVSADVPDHAPPRSCITFCTASCCGPSVAWLRCRALPDLSAHCVTGSAPVTVALSLASYHAARPIRLVGKKAFRFSGVPGVTAAPTAKGAHPRDDQPQFFR